MTVYCAAPNCRTSNGMDDQPATSGQALAAFLETLRRIAASAMVGHRVVRQGRKRCRTTLPGSADGWPSSIGEHYRPWTCYPS